MQIVRSDMHIVRPDAFSIRCDISEVSHLVTHAHVSHDASSNTYTCVTRCIYSEVRQLWGISEVRHVSSVASSNTSPHLSCVMTHWHVCHDALICVAWMIDCVAWLIDMYETWIHMWLIGMYQTWIHMWLIDMYQRWIHMWLIDIYQTWIHMWLIDMYQRW